MRFRRDAAALACLACHWLVFANVLQSVTQAQMPETTAGPVIPTAEQIQARIDEVDADATLDADTKAKALERFRSALREHAKLKAAAAAEAQFQQDAATAAERVAKLKAELEQAIASAEPVDVEGRSLADLDADRANREAKLAVLKQQLVEIEGLRKQRTDRRAEIRRLQAEAEPRRVQLRQEAEAPPVEGEPPILAEARRLDANLKLAAFERTSAAYEFELAKYTAEETVKLLTHQEELKRDQLAREEEAVRTLTRVSSDRRRAQAEDQVRQAEEQKLLTHPLLRDEAEQNRLYAEEVRRFSTKIEGVEREAEQTRAELKEQQAKFADIHKKEREIGLTRPIGLMLREQRAQLPDLRELQRQLDGREALIEQARLMSWQYADELASQSDARSLVNRVVPTASLTAEQRLELERMAGELLTARRDLLTELEQISEKYFAALFELDAIDHRYLQASSEYLHYINERILWIRSADPLSLKLVTADAKSWEWMTSLEQWRAVADALSHDPLEHPFAFWPTLLAVVALFYLRYSVRPRIRDLGESASKRGFLRYTPTAQAAALTMLASLTTPAALLFVSWRLEAVLETSGFALALARAFIVCATVLFPLNLLRETCRTEGLAEAHFNWPPRAITHVRQVLGWLKTLGMPVVFVAVLGHEHLPLSGGTTAERLCFIMGMLLVAIAAHRLLLSQGEFSKAFAVENPGGPFTRFRPVWYTLALAVPLGMGALSALGYHYTALQFADRLLWTSWLALAGILARGMAVRWVVLSRRRLLLDQAYQRRAAAATEDAQDSAGSTLKPPVIEETDVAKSTSQTRRLVDIVTLGLAATVVAMIWAETLPAFGLLDREIWKSDGSVAATAPADGDAGSDSVINPAVPLPSAENSIETTLAESITTLDLAVAILLAVFTFLAARNLPGLMEMSVLSRLPVDNATRYAATRLASYAIVGVGVLLATNRLGLRWQNVQWLAAALTVGLGFGLQEVFANFVSGLIILFERPIRVGDIVTIDDVTGVVSRIRMRATTIINWDRKEFIVPNKEFITGRVLNWTLSDAVNRITINVGVAHGTDTDAARELLLRICDEHPLLLKDPPPMANFESIGDSTYNFVIRCFLPSLDNRLDTIHQLNTRIAAEFRAAGIKIAYPQRDLHLRTAPSLGLVQADPEEPEETFKPERAAG